MSAMKRAVLWILLAGSASIASAQGTGEDAAESRATSFQAVQGPSKEDVPGGPLLLGAYGFILLALVAYVARLGSLSGKNQRELERLSSLLERARKG